MFNTLHLKVSCDMSVGEAKKFPIKNGLYTVCNFGPQIDICEKSGEIFGRQSKAVDLDHTGCLKTHLGYQSLYVTKNNQYDMKLCRIHRQTRVMLLLKTYFPQISLCNICLSHCSLFPGCEWNSFRKVNIMAKA